MYFTRGYVFQTYEYGQRRVTSNDGVCVRGETDFYRVLQEIIEVEYPGIVNMKTVLFKCDWFDPVIGRGVRVSKFGVVDVHASRQYNKFEPYILASQAEQISLVPYPRIQTSGIRWLAVIKVAPRGRIVVDELPMQQDTSGNIPRPNETTEEVILVDEHNQEFEYLLDDTEDEAESSDQYDDENDDVDSDIASSDDVDSE